MCHNIKNTDVIWHVPKGVGTTVRIVPGARPLTAVRWGEISGYRAGSGDVKGVVFKASGETDASKMYCGKLGSSVWLRLRVHTQLWGTREVVASSSWNSIWKALKAALRSLGSLEYLE